MSTQSAAQWVPEPETVSPLKLQAAERLAVHRARRGPRPPAEATAEADLFQDPPLQPDTRAERIAATVAERYAHSQSYRAFLAAEAERATERAHAAAEIARRTAEAVAAVHQQLLLEIEAQVAAEHAGQEQTLADEDRMAASLTTHAEASAILTKPAPALTVRLYEVAGLHDPRGAVANAVPYEPLEEEERRSLDDEIAFRQSPNFEDFQQAAVPLPANLIEFPRQLVAARKARPRIAEGPLRDEEERTGTQPQLRIFEVEPEFISTAAEPDESAPEWASIHLSACIPAEPVLSQEYAVSEAHRPQTAPVALRLMAALVDGCILLGVLLAFTVTAAYSSGEVPTGSVAALSAAGVLATLFLGYHLLFFTLAESTPGMRYARIGLCTLNDENPSRAAMRRRLVAMLLAACPLGLGLLWSLIDEEGLGWHDRISRMYQRSF